MEENIVVTTNSSKSEHLLKTEADFGDVEVASSSGKQLYFHSDFSFLDSDEELESKSSKVNNFYMKYLERFNIYLPRDKSSVLHLNKLLLISV